MTKRKNPWLVDARVRVIGRVGDYDTGKTGRIVSVETGTRRVGKSPVRIVSVLLRDGNLVVFRSDQLEII